MMQLKHIISFVVMLLTLNVASAQPSLKHDLNFDTLAKVWDEAIPLGNGMVGALVYEKAGHLRFALDRSDLWDERPMKGLHRKEFSYQWVQQQVREKNYAQVQQYFDAPYDRESGPSKISGGALEFVSKSWGNVTSVHLSLSNALCTVVWSSGIKLTTFVHATEPIGWFRFENAPSNFTPTLKAPKYKNNSGKSLDSLKSNDPAKLGYSEGTITADNNSIIYHQPGFNNFFYDISVQWKRIGERTIEGVWSVSSNFSPSNPSATNSTSNALKRSFNKDLSSHAKWWSNFWSKSSIQLPDIKIEQQWYRDIYKFGSSARKGAPPILLQGVWTADNDRLPPWKGDYHHDLNTEMSYWPAYSSNHLDEAMAFVDHLHGNKENYKRYTQLFFNTSGVNVPGVTTLNGTEMGGWIQYALSPTVAGWLAQHFYWQWIYSKDEFILQHYTYPWFKDVTKYFESITQISKEGFRELPISSSPEINNNSIGAWFNKTTNYDLSLMKFVFTTAASLARQQSLKVDAENFDKIAAQFRNYAITPNKELMYAPDSAYRESHRHFSHAMAIHPLGLLSWEDGIESQTIIKNTIHQLDSIGPAYWNGYSYAWLANLKARAKDGNGALKALSIFNEGFLSKNSFHVNGDQSGKGYSQRTYRPFTLEGNFGAAAAVQEMLLQSYAGFIEVMPAIPDSWQDASFKTLRAEGAFLVSAQQLNGKVSNVTIKSEKGGTTKLKLPSKGYVISKCKGVKTRMVSEDFIELTFKVGGSITLKNSSKQTPL